MKSLVAAFVISATIAALLTPLVRAWALRLGAVSNPGGRHHHGHTIPRLGGVAIFVAFCLPLIGLFIVESSVSATFRQDWVRVCGLLGGGFAMCVVGFIDDTRRLRALYKLYAQVAVAGMAWACGFRISAIEVPLVGVLSMGIFALPVTIMWIVGVTNAINLIDGLDGLAAGVVFFAALTNLIVAQLAGASFIAVLMAAVIGSVLGFLLYNFNPARIFMGDSGSYFLGFILATTSLAGASTKASTAVSIVVPVLALGLPIFDTLFAMVRRFLERRSVFSPDRGHIHHRLIDMGITHRRAVLLLYGVSLAGTVAAIGLTVGRNWAVGGAILAMSVLVTGVIRFAGTFNRTFQQRRQKSRLRTHHTELLRGLIPDLPTLVGRARSVDDLWASLNEILVRAELARFEILDSPHAHEGTVIVESSQTANGDPSSLDVVRSRYPLGRDGRAVASVRFCWHADYGEVSPQEEILLQIVADVVARRLGELGSRLAPIASVEASTPIGASVRVGVS